MASIINSTTRVEPGQRAAYFAAQRQHPLVARSSFGRHACDLLGLNKVAIELCYAPRRRPFQLNIPSENLSLMEGLRQYNEKWRTMDPKALPYVGQAGDNLFYVKSGDELYLRTTENVSYYISYLDDLMTKDPLKLDFYRQLSGGIWLIVGCGSAYKEANILKLLKENNIPWPQHIVLNDVSGQFIAAQENLEKAGWMGPVELFPGDIASKEFYRSARWKWIVRSDLPKRVLSSGGLVNDVVPPTINFILKSLRQKLKPGDVVLWSIDCTDGEAFGNAYQQPDLKALFGSAVNYTPHILGLSGFDLRQTTCSIDIQQEDFTPATPRRRGMPNTQEIQRENNVCTTMRGRFKLTATQTLKPLPGMVGTPVVFEAGELLTFDPILRMKPEEWSNRQVNAGYHRYGTITMLDYRDTMALDGRSSVGVNHTLQLFGPKPPG